MMGNIATWKVAIDAFHMPSRVRRLRSSPLPEDVFIVLRIAAGDEAATVEVVELSGRPREVVRRAAAFYIEQILLCPQADSYRVLGANQNATPGELRRNMALLLRWLHPDLHNDGNRSIFAGRVTRAWEDLKKPEHRAAYDRAQSALKKKGNPLLHDIKASGPNRGAWRLTGDQAGSCCDAHWPC